MAVELLLLGCEGQVDEGPGDDPGASIEEELEVKPLPNSGVKLNAHHVVVKEIACEFALKYKEQMHVVNERISQVAYSAGMDAGAQPSPGTAGPREMTWGETCRELQGCGRQRSRQPPSPPADSVLHSSFTSGP